MSDFEKLNIKEAIIVEGRYDKIVLQSVVNSLIITTNGFRIFNNKETQLLIRKLAQTRGILVMTDVDSAGFVIRNFLNGIVDKSQIKHCYIPTIYGKEKRKRELSKEGKLGVEGINRQQIVNAILNSSATILSEQKVKSTREITKMDFYDLGFIGKDNSAKLRKDLLLHLGLPEYLSTNAMLGALNCLYTYDEFIDIINNFNKS